MVGKNFLSELLSIVTIRCFLFGGVLGIDVMKVRALGQGYPARKGEEPEGPRCDHDALPAGPCFLRFFQGSRRKYRQLLSLVDLRVYMETNLAEFRKHHGEWK